MLLVKRAEDCLVRRWESSWLITDGPAVLTDVTSIQRVSDVKGLTSAKSILRPLVSFFFRRGRASTWCCRMRAFCSVVRVYEGSRRESETRVRVSKASL